MESAFGFVVLVELYIANEVLTVVKVRQSRRRWPVVSILQFESSFYLSHLPNICLH